MMICAGITSQSNVMTSRGQHGGGLISSALGGGGSGHDRRIRRAGLPGTNLALVHDHAMPVHLHDRRRSASVEALNLFSESEHPSGRSENGKCSAFKRRPSFPQGGLDWSSRKRSREHPHDNLSWRPETCAEELSETEEAEEKEEEEKNDVPGMTLHHQCTCPLYSLDPHRQGRDLSWLKVEDERSQSQTANTTSSPSPQPTQLQNQNVQGSKPVCTCGNHNGDFPDSKNNNNNNENESRHNNRKPREGKKRNSRETIIINVGGQVFETYRSTLRRLKTSVFTSDESLQRYWRRSHNDYFFDRDPTAFGSILNFLRTGELHIPTNMCGPALQTELEFWGIDEVDIARCCWTQYNTWKTQCRSLEKLEYDRKFSTTQQFQSPPDDSTCWIKFRTRVWQFLQDPGSSRMAKVYAWVSIIFVFVSIFSFCAETHPMFKVKARDMVSFKSFYNFIYIEPIDWGEDDVIRISNNINNTSINNTNDPNNNLNLTENYLSFKTNNALNSTGCQYKGSIADYDYDGMGDCDEVEDYEGEHWGEKALPHPALLICDLACLMFFTLEYVTRFMCSPSKLNFLRALQNIVDFLAFAPDYIDLLFRIIAPNQTEGMAVMEMLFILRILRLFRIFRLIRHVPGLWILLYTLKASFNELMLMCVFLLIGMVVFATLIHFVEPDGQFDNIPVGFWWSVVTMTTVGYGDMYPVSAAGYFIGSCCAVAGLLMIAFTVPIIVSNFVLYYTHVQYGYARKDRDLAKMKEEEEAEEERKRSYMDVETTGALEATGTQCAATTTRNGNIYTYVNKHESDDSRMSLPSHCSVQIHGNTANV